MQPKKKLCDGCGEPKFIWKNEGGKRFCKQCWSALSVTTKPKPTVKQKPIRPRSLKRSKEESEYSQKRKVYLDKHPMCEAHIPSVCTGQATEVHHKRGRIGADLTDETLFLGLCHACHEYIENNRAFAIEQGFSIKRIS